MQTWLAKCERHTEELIYLPDFRTLDITSGRKPRLSGQVMSADGAQALAAAIDAASALRSS
jgi:hypothetical protein